MTLAAAIIISATIGAFVGCTSCIVVSTLSDIKTDNKKNDKD